MKRSLLQILKEYRNGWIICAVSIVVNTARAGINYSFGLYIAELRKLYGSPMADLNWISVIASSITFFLSPLPALIIRQCPRRGYTVACFLGVLIQGGACLISSFVTHVPWLLITFGVTFGIGGCLTMMASTLVLDEFFPVSHEFHECATSIFQCAFPSGLMIFSPIYAWLINTYSWRWSLRVAAVKIILVGTVSSLLLLLERPHCTEKKTEDKEGKSLCLECLEIFRRPERMCWIVGVSLSFACEIVLVNNLPHYLKERGYTTIESSLPNTVIGITQLFIFAVIPFVGNKLKGRLFYLNILSCFLQTVLFLVWSLVNPSYEVVILFSAIFGLIYSFFAFVYPATAEVMEMGVDAGWTFTCVGMGVGALVGPLMSGVIYDHTGSYVVVFIVLPVVCFLDFILFAAIPVIKSCRRIRYDALL